MARWMDAAILNKLGQRQLGCLPADIVKGADNDHAGGVVHDDIHTGSLFEGANVPTLAADDAPLDVIAWNIHAADGRVGGMFGSVA